MSLAVTADVSSANAEGPNNVTKLIIMIIAVVTFLNLLYISLYPPLFFNLLFEGNKKTPFGSWLPF
ncbi:hypothetical protein SDC9_176543 [bioreactor metagenome]|uniref:Uncharacterized protein n=1 Tax=bioreactor metagenome TaxID=1076179 RepID=A0A645GT17_9ZZZZ